MNAICKTCRWWDTTHDSDKEDREEAEQAPCKRHAPSCPSPDKPNNDIVWGEWPETLPVDFCGDHEPKEKN